MAAKDQARQLYAGDLPVDPPVTKDFLQQFFGEMGTVEQIDLKSDRTDRRGKPICYAFVTFNSHEAAKKALTELNYTKLNGIPIRLSFSDAETNRIRKSGQGNLFIKNLDPGIEVSQLHDALGNFGEIISCKIATDTENKSLGYGYVQFREKKDADQAMQDLKEATINGRPVHIEPYQKRQRQNPEDTYTNVYIKNLPESVKGNDAFRNLILEFCGQLEDEIDSSDKSQQPQLMETPDTHEPRGFGFCLMKNHDAAKQLVETLNGKEIDGKVLFASRAMGREERIRFVQENSAKWRKANYEKYKDRNLYVRGFDETMTEQQLKDMFSRYGEVESVKIMTDEHGASKKFGFVCFVKPEDATTCIEDSMVGIKFNQQNAYVAKAVPKEELQRRNLQKQTSRNKEGAHLQQAGQMGPAFGPGYQMPAPGFSPQMQPFGMGGYPFPQMGMDQPQMPMGFPQAPMGMGPQMMMHTEPRDMIRREIIDKYGQGQGQPFIKALGGLSDDQCKALSKDQDKLNAWLEKVPHA